MAGQEFARLVRERVTDLSAAFGNLTALKTLDLSRCESLVSLPKSIGNLTALTSLDLSQCESLESLPESIGNLTALTSLNLRGCSVLSSLLESFGNLTALTSLDLEECSSLDSLPESFGNLTALTSLELSWCPALNSLPPSFGNLTALTFLDLRHCQLLSTLPESFGNLTALTRLDLMLCKSLTSLPESFGNLTALTSLDLCRCKSLDSLPESFGSLTALTLLNLSYCTHLTHMSMAGLGSLTSLDLEACETLRVLTTHYWPHYLREVSEGDERLLIHAFKASRNGGADKPIRAAELTSLRWVGCTELRVLDVSGCCKLSHLPRSFIEFKRLVVIDLSGCEELDKVPDLRPCPLRLLRLRDCGNLRAVPRVSVKAIIDGDVSGCDNIAEALADNVNNTLNAVLVAAALLATLGYSSLANPTDWDDTVTTPDSLQNHGDAAVGLLATYFVASQVSFYGSIWSIVWCLLAVHFNSDAEKMLRRGGDRKGVMLGMAIGALTVSIAAILVAYICSGLTSVSMSPWWLVVLATAAACAVGMAWSLWFVFADPDKY